MNSTAVQYAGALRHAGCTLSELRRTAGCLTGCAELWDALCSPAVSAREKKAVLARLPAFDARGELRHFYLLLADKNRFALLPEIVRQFRLLEKRENGEGLCVFRSAREPEEQSLGALARLLCARHGCRAVTFEIVTDETLLGGFTAEIDGVTYDKSVRGQLRALAHDL
mgnify:FL=1